MRKTGIISYRVDDPSSGLFHLLTPGQRRRTIMSCHASRAFLYFNAVGTYYITDNVNVPI